MAQQTRFKRILLLVFIFCITTALCEETGNNPVYFVQITDTHFGLYDNSSRTEKIVAQINALPFPISCVLHTGDIFSDNIQNEKILAESKAILTKLKAPILFVPGNHDIHKKTAASDGLTYTKNFNPLVESKEYNGMVFITVFTEPLSKHFTDQDFNPLQALKTELEKAGGKPVVICHHTPSVDDFYLNKVHRGWPDEARMKWITLLNQHNVKAVLAGHFHRDELHWLGKIPLYVCPPVSAAFGRQATFRIYKYRGGNVSYQTQYVK